MPKGKVSRGKAAVGRFERIPSGIPGLDRLIEGGLIKGSTNLLAGGTGTGKTIFCAQFILEGLKRGEKCAFLTLEETPEDIIGDCANFGWDLPKYVANGQLELVYKDPFELTNVARAFLDHVRQKSMQRVAIDSTSVLGLYYRHPSEVRKNLFNALTALKKSGATVVVTAEAPEEGRMLTRFGVEEYITDSVIVLHFTGLGGAAFHSLQIRKMRRTAHGKDVYPMEITNRGLVVRPV